MIICLYHKHCMDGKGAAAVVHRKHNNVRAYPVQYNEELPEELRDYKAFKGSTIYIVDFSLPQIIMIQIMERCHKMIWIDHHKTAVPMIEPLHVRSEVGENNLKVFFDQEESGASLTWKALYDKETPPPLIPYIRDRDLWKWELPFSREVSAALAKRFPDDNFRGLLELDPRDLIGEGKRLYEKTRADAAKNARRAFDVHFHGIPAKMVNTYTLISETGEYILDHMDVDLAIMFWREPDKWIYSLRSRGDVDASILAKYHGGGGHAQAAGLSGPWDPSQLEELKIAAKL